jgi:hypothetical protein
MDENPYRTASMKAHSGGEKKAEPSGLLTKKLTDTAFSSLLEPLLLQIRSQIRANEVLFFEALKNTVSFT